MKRGTEIEGTKMQVLKLIDPGSGREKGIITQVELGSDLQVFGINQYANLTCLFN